MTFGLVAAAGSAGAADMPLTALPAPAVFSWTGFYGGANVGYGWGNSNNIWNIFAANSGGDTVCPPGGGSLCVAGADSNHMNGALGGLQIGYNWQTGRYVFGIETDFDATGQRGSQTFNGANGASTLVPAGFGPIAAAPMAAAYTEKLSWLGTFRGRVGIASDRTLFLCDRRSRLWRGKEYRFCNNIRGQHGPWRANVHSNLSGIWHLSAWQLE